MYYNSFKLMFKNKQYFGFKLFDISQAINEDAYVFVFKNKDLYFKLHLSSYFMTATHPDIILTEIERMIYTISDFKKLVHNQKFNEKMDDLLK